MAGAWGVQLGQDMWRFPDHLPAGGRRPQGVPQHMQPSRISADDGARGAGGAVLLSLSFLVLSYRRFVEGRLQARLSRYRPASAGPASGQRRRPPWPDLGAEGRGAERHRENDLWEKR